MGIRTAYKDATFGERLIQLDARGTRAINELDNLRTELPHLKTQIAADADYTQAEKDAANAEVDAVIAALMQRIKDFANGLP